MTAIRLIITGMVQGVGYRAAFADKAIALSLDGWVRNRHDGSVEALIAGKQQALQDIIGWAAKGPPDARVDDVALTRESLSLAPGFRIAFND
jgi:acylphosphatase